MLELDSSMARHAGRLLARARLGSAHAIDAFVVAAAASYEWAVIATGGTVDLTRFATSLPHVHVVAI